MIPRLHIPLVTTVLVSAPLATPLGAQEPKAPPVFRDLDFAAAKTESESTGRLLVLDAMTSWCGPCKIMDKTTWVDPELVAWLEANTVPIQLDMDVHVDVKEALGITAFPTIIVLKGETVLDRVVGLRDAEFMLEWLGGLRSGKTHAERMVEKADALHRGELDLSSAAKVELAEGLASVGEFDRALRLCAWLFDNAREDRLPSGPVGLAVANLCADLTGTGDSGLATTRSMRDKLSKLVETDASRADLLAWMRLSRALDDTAPVLEWSRKQVESREGQARLRAGGDLWFDFLVDAGAWEAAGFTIVDAVTHLLGHVRAIRLESGEEEAEVARNPGFNHGFTPPIPMLRRRGPDEPERTLAEQYDFQMRDDGGQFYAALLASGRRREATKLADYMLENALDKRAASLAMITWCLRAGSFEVARERHLGWLQRSWL